VLSQKGWVRAAKGHEIDAAALNYKAGDSYLSAAKGKTNQPAIFLDSTGRTYALMAHSLPSARGQGEPITGRVNPAPGASFVSVLMGSEDKQYVFASSAGYGFVVPLKELITKNKAGKAVLKLPEGATVVSPSVVENKETDLLVSVTSAGHLLVFPVSELPELNRGKGNKIINIPSKLFKAGEEYMQAIVVVPEGKAVRCNSGKRHLTLKAKDLEIYKGERGRRGNKLPRGFRAIDSLEVG
jgi:topoisomerase-4 subunit A